MKTFKTKIPAIAGVAAFVLSLSIYTVTACPVVFAGDSGELITAAYTMGVAHPPGYPLFCLLGKVFSYLPLAGVAFRINLLSGFFASLAVYVLYLLIKKLLTGKGGVILAFCAALFLAFSPIFWEQALFAKGALYGLNAFLILLLYYLLLLEASPLLLGVLAGLSLANHHTALPFAGLALLFLFLTRKDRKKALINYLLAACLTAVTLYLYLPLSAAGKPPINWGNPKDFDSALFHIFRGQYGDARAPLTLAVYFKEIFVYGKLVVSQFSFFSLLAPFGLVYLYRTNKKYTGLLLFSFAAYFLLLLLIIEHNFSEHVLYLNRVFFLPLFALLAVWISAGFAFFLEKLPGGRVLYLLPALLPVLFLGVNYGKSDRSKSYLLYEYGVNTFRSIEKNALLFTSGDHSAFVSVYLKTVEKARPDLLCYDDTGSIFENIYGADFAGLPRGKHEQRLTDTQLSLIEATKKPVYFILGSNLQDISVLSGRNNYKPLGLVYKIAKEDKASFYAKEPLREFNFRNLDKFEAQDYLETALAAQIYFMKGEELYARGRIAEATTFYDKAAQIGSVIDDLLNNLNIVFMRPGYTGKLLKFAEETVKKNPYLATARANLGNVYMYFREPDKAIIEYNKALELEPSNAEVVHNLGVAWLKRNDYEKAAACFKSSVEIFSGVPTDFLNLIECYIRLNKPEDALKTAVNGVNFHPGNGDLRLNCANLLFRSGRFQEALLQYDYIIKNIDPGVPEIYYDMGVTLLRLNMPAEAEPFFQRALELKPGYTEAKKYLNEVKEFLKKQK